MSVLMIYSVQSRGSQDTLSVSHQHHPSQISSSHNELRFPLNTDSLASQTNCPTTTTLLFVSVSLKTLGHSQEWSHIVFLPGLCHHVTYSHEGLSVLNHASEFLAPRCPLLYLLWVHSSVSDPLLA